MGSSVAAGTKKSLPAGEAKQMHLKEKECNKTF
jgi:hypothetical protein